MIERIHICGAGGIGTSGVALIYQALGCKVTATDARQSEITQMLSKEGIAVEYKPRADWAEAAQLVVVPASFPEDHPEVIAAKSHAIPVVTRTEALLRACVEKCVEVTLCVGTVARAKSAALIAHHTPNAGYCLGLMPRAFSSHARWGSHMVLDIDERELLSNISLISNLASVHIVVSDWAKESLGYYAKGTSLERFVSECAKSAVTVVYPENGSDPAENVVRFAVMHCKSDSPVEYVDFEIQMDAEETRVISAGHVDKLKPCTFADASAVAASRLVLGGAVDLLAMECVGWFEQVDNRRTFDIRMHPVGIQNAVKSMRARFPEESLTVVIKPFASTHCKYDMNIWRKAFAGATEVVVVTPGYEVPDKACRQLATALKMRGLAASVQPRKQVYADYVPAGAHQLWIGAPELLKP